MTGSPAALRKSFALFGRPEAFLRLGALAVSLALFPGLATAEQEQQVPPKGTEERVNTQVDRDQSRPVIVQLALDPPPSAICGEAGHHLVAWGGDGPPLPGSDFPEIGVFGRRYCSDGTPVDGVEFQLAEGIPRDLDVASDLSGHTIVVWENESGTNLFGNLCFTDDLPCQTEDEIEIGSLSGPTNGRNRLAVAMDATREFVVAWSDGFALQPTLSVRVCTGEPVQCQAAISDGFFQVEPAVAKNFTSGEFLVVWTTYPQLKGTDDPNNPGCKGEACCICGQMFDSEGLPLGPVFQVEDQQPATGFLGSPAVARDLLGNYIVTWVEFEDPLPNQDDGRRILAKRFDDTGAVLNSDFVVAEKQFEERQVRAPAVASGDAEGSFLVVWSVDFPDTPPGGQRRGRWYPGNLGDEGLEGSDEFRVNSFLNFKGAENQTLATSVAADFEGDFVVAWDLECQGCVDREIDVRRYHAPVELQINDFSISEGSPTAPSRSLATFTVQGSKPHPNAEDMKVEYRSEDDTANQLTDYESVAGTLIIAPCPTDPPDPECLPQGGIPITITPDAEFEEDESFFVNLAKAQNAVLTRARGTGTILNDDPPGLLRILDATPGSPREHVTLPEGDLEPDPGAPGGPDVPARSPMLFSLRISPPQSVGASVAFETADGSAVAGEDYEATTGVVSIPPNVAEVQFAVDVFGDHLIEGNETFSVQLLEPTNALLEASEARGTILDDDCAASAALSPELALWGNDGGLSGGAGNPPDIALTGATDGDKVCDWEVSSTQRWLTILTPAELGGAGDGAIVYNVAANPSVDARHGTIRLAGPCSGPEELTLAPPDPIEGFFGACTRILASTRVSGPTAFESASIGLANGFGVGEGIEVLAAHAAPLEAEIQQAGVVCDFAVEPLADSIGSAGGSRQVTVTATDPVCAWNAISHDSWITIQGLADRTGSGVVDYDVGENGGGARTGSLAIAGQTVTLQQGAAFFDHFDDGLLAPDWTYGGPACWSESGSLLRGQGCLDVALATARPAFGGCDLCTVATTIRLMQFGRGLVRFLGWYKNAANHLELVMDEFGDAWTLTQFVAGSAAATATVSMDIDVGREYGVEIGFDGSTFELKLDGIHVLDLAVAPGSTPAGTVGFAVGPTDAAFDFVRVLSQ